MSIFKLEHNVPDVYANGSRDFQLLCRLYNLVINSTKYDIDSIINIADTELCRDNMLNNLSSRIGYISDYELSNDTLRYILRAFPIIIKNKGTKKGIQQAINVFLKLSGIIANSNILITTKADTNNYTIDINLETDPYSLDEDILKEILSFIIPAGFIVKINFVSKPTFEAYNILHNIESTIISATSINNSIYVNDTDYGTSGLAKPAIGLTRIGYYNE